jgi:DNA-binding LacI/PurR family transcriptional regulator
MDLNQDIFKLSGDSPKYLEISKTLKNLIINGTLPPGSKLPSELHLAKGFGVSQISIRNALKKLNEEGYVESIHGKGSFVAQPPCFFSGPKAGVIGFYTDVSRQRYIHFTSILHGISTAAQYYGLDLHIIHPSCSTDGIHTDKKLLGLIEEGKLDGLIIDVPKQRGGVSWNDYHYLDRTGIPFVLWGNYKDAKGRSLVTARDSHWLEDLIKQTVDKGYRRIALVLGQMDPPDAFSSSSAQYLLPIYKRVTRELFIPIRLEYIVQADYSVESGYLAGKQLLSFKERPEVIIGADDVNAVGVVKAAFDMEINVPQDVKVWGVTDFISGSRLSSVAFDWEHAGAKAVADLVHIIEGENTEQNPTNYTLIERESTSVELERPGALKIFIEEYLFHHPIDREKMAALEQVVKPVYVDE